MGIEKFTQRLNALTLGTSIMLSGCKCNDNAIVEPDIQASVSEVRSEIDATMAASTYSAEKFEQFLLNLPPEKRNPEYATALKKMAVAGIDVYNEGYEGVSIISQLDPKKLDLIDKLIQLHNAGIQIDGYVLKSLNSGRTPDFEKLSNSISLLFITPIMFTNFVDQHHVEMNDEMINYVLNLEELFVKELEKDKLYKEANVIKKLISIYKKEKQILKNDPSKFFKSQDENLMPSVETIFYTHIDKLIKIASCHTDLIPQNQKFEMFDKANIVQIINGIAKQIAQLDPKKITSPEYLSAVKKLRDSGVRESGQNYENFEKAYGSILFSMPYEAAINDDYINNIILLQKEGVKITIGTVYYIPDVNYFYGIKTKEDDNLLFSLSIDMKGASKEYIDGLIELKKAGATINADLVRNITLENMLSPSFKETLLDLYNNDIEAGYMSDEKINNPIYIAALKQLHRDGVKIDSNFIENLSIERALDKEYREALPEWQKIAPCLSDLLEALTPEKAVDAEYRKAISRLLCNEFISDTHYGGNIEHQIIAHALAEITIEQAKNSEYMEVIEKSYYGGNGGSSYEIPDYDDFVKNQKKKVMKLINYLKKNKHLLLQQRQQVT